MCQTEPIHCVLQCIRLIHPDMLDIGAVEMSTSLDNGKEMQLLFVESFIILVSSNALLRSESEYRVVFSSGYGLMLVSPITADVRNVDFYINTVFQEDGLIQNEVSVSPS